MVGAMVSIGIVGAFLAGVLSLLSPCSALLLPAFFAYAFNSKTRLFARTAVFLLGLLVIMVPLGMGVGWLGKALAVHRDTLIVGGGLVVIAFGIATFFGLGFSIAGVSQLSARAQGVSWLSVFALGAVYGFAGFCAGPMLGAVLTTALTTSNPVYSGGIMAMYALGMTVPLFLLAGLWERYDLAHASWLRGKAIGVGPLTLNSMSMLAGALFIVIGLLFVLSHGTAGLPSVISVDQQLLLQSSALRWMSGLPGKLVLLAVLGAALAWAVHRLMKTKDIP